MSKNICEEFTQLLADYRKETGHKALYSMWSREAWTAFCEAFDVIGVSHPYGTASRVVDDLPGSQIFVSHSPIGVMIHPNRIDRLTPDTNEAIVSLRREIISSFATVAELMEQQNRIVALLAVQSVKTMFVDNHLNRITDAIHAMVAKWRT